MTQSELLALRSRTASVPCEGCRACCKSDRIVLSEKDDAARFAWHFEQGVRVLDRKPNDECIYLTADGCGRHGDAPDICKRFDCRVLFLVTPKPMRRIRIEQNPTMKFVYEAGKIRASTLET